MKSQPSLVTGLCAGCRRLTDEPHQSSNKMGGHGWIGFCGNVRLNMLSDVTAPDNKGYRRKNWSHGWNIHKKLQYLPMCLLPVQYILLLTKNQFIAFPFLS